MSSYRRRIETLEQTIKLAAMAQEFERQLQEHWPEVERIAAELEMTPEAFAAEVRADASRRAEIGNDAADREYAETLGLTVEQVRDPEFLREWGAKQDREWREWQEKVRAERAERITWRGGVMYRGDVPVEGQHAS